MKAKVIGLDGTIGEAIELPSVFETEYRPKLIHRAVLAMQSAKKQPKGANPRAGKKNTALYIGYRGAPTHLRTMNMEVSRLPRMRNTGTLVSGRVASVPHAVGGPAAHPLKAWEVIEEKINKKERKLALKSAIAATIVKKLVERRFIFKNDLPIVVDSKLEGIVKTQELVKILEKIGVGADVTNAKLKMRKRAGKGKARGRLWKEKKSVLIVSSKNSPVLKAARNLPGVEAVTTNSLNVELLAPGAEAGRLVVWTKDAINALDNKPVAQVAKKEVATAAKPAEKKVVAKKAKQ